MELEQQLRAHIPAVLAVGQSRAPSCRRRPEQVDLRSGEDRDVQFSDNSTAAVSLRGLPE